MSAYIKWFLSFRFSTTVAMQMKMTILSYYLYQINGSAAALGLLGLYEALPKIVLALPAGYLVERMEKRKALLIVVGGYLLLTLFIILAIDYFQGHNQTITHCIYVLVFLIGVVGSMGMGASVALFSSFIPRDKMAQYSAMNSNAWQIGAIVGPIIGGFLIKIVGSELALSFILVFFIIALLSLSKLPLCPSQMTDSSEKNQAWHKMLEGLGYVFQNKVMLWAISLDLFAVLFGGCVALLPIFAKDILMVDSDSYGMLRAAMPCGAALTMLYLTRNPIRQNTGRWLLIFIGLFGLATMLFAISTSFYLSLVLLFLMGAFDAVSVVIRGAILILETPDHMRARVTSVNSMFISSSNEIGAFESGIAAHLLGTVRSVLFGGSMTLLFVWIAWNKAKELKNYVMK